MPEGIAAFAVGACVALAPATAFAADKTAAKAAPAKAAPVQTKPAAETAEAPAIIGQLLSYAVRKKKESLLDIARHFELGYVEMIAANPGVDPWTPGVGTRLTIPTAFVLPDAPREGIVINIPEMRLYYFPPGGEPPQTYPLGVGRDGLETPSGATTVVRKMEKPTWRPTPRMRKEKPDLPEAVPPGPDNPLGDYILYLGWQSYGIHGTNKPWGVGRRVSSGCIRMYPEGVARLYPLVKPGTPVRVVNQPAKIAWYGSELFLEVHPTPEQADELEKTGVFSVDDIPDLVLRIIARADIDKDRIDWATVNREVRERSGVPVQITVSTFLEARREERRPATSEGDGRSIRLGAPLSTIEAEMEQRGGAPAPRPGPAGGRPNGERSSTDPPDPADRAQVPPDAASATGTDPDAPPTPLLPAAPTEPVASPAGWIATIIPAPSHAANPAAANGATATRTNATVQSGAESGSASGAEPAARSGAAAEQPKAPNPGQGSGILGTLVLPAPPKAAPPVTGAATETGDGPSNRVLRQLRDETGARR